MGMLHDQDLRLSTDGNVHCRIVRPKVAPRERLEPRGGAERDDYIVQTAARGRVAVRSHAH